MSTEKPEYTRLSDGTYSVETGTGTTRFAAPESAIPAHEPLPADEAHLLAWAARIVDTQPGCSYTTVANAVVFWHAESAAPHNATR